MQRRDLPDLLPKGALPFGLGCSRLGSVNGATMEMSRRILEHALEAGIRFFDTSNIYAQGDSERLLGGTLQGRHDCMICSKAGKFLPWQKRMLLPLKGVIARVVHKSEHARRSVSEARSRPMPTRWDHSFLTQSIDASLRRLRRDRIDVFMLHSPSADDLASGEAMGPLETAQIAGKLGLIGVSVDDVACAKKAMKDPRVQILQIPLLPKEAEFEAVINLASEAGIHLIAREIFGGTRGISGAPSPTLFAANRLQDLIRRQDLTLPLVGTTKLENLMASITAARDVHTSVDPKLSKSPFKPSPL